MRLDFGEFNEFYADYEQVFLRKKSVNVYLCFGRENAKISCI